VTRGRGKDRRDQNGRKRRRFAGLRVVGAVIGLAATIAGCGGSSHHTGSTAASAPATVSAPQPSTSTSAHSTSGGSTPATAAPKINLLSANGNKSIAAIAEVVKQGGKEAIAIVGHGLPPNTKHDAYAVWLYNAPRDAVLLGFVNPGVGKNGRLETTGPLPANAAHFKQLLITIETTATPRQPGRAILRGKLTGV
jgi:hypothetical protein